MNIHELEKRLQEEGCSHTYYSIGSGGSDVFCLDNWQGTWRVFYTERGRDDDPIFESQSEEEACEFFFTYITTRIRHDHLVGYFISLEKAETLTAMLKEHGIESYRNDMPYGGWQDPRYRVFVIGKDVFKVRDIFGELPVKDES